MERVKLSFGSKGKKEELHLQYIPRQTNVAKRWIESLNLAYRQSEILESTRWYNFPGHLYSSISDVGKKLNQCIEQLNRIYPNLIQGQFDENRIQDSINLLHTHFVDQHSIIKENDFEAQQLWSEFNNDLHALEAIMRAQNDPVRESSIVVTWKNNFRVQLKGQDDNEFTISKKFGTCYLSYCQVGRHFYELFLSDDQVADDEHVQPLQYSSADTYFWFGQSTSKEFDQRRYEKMRVWFQKQQERFRKMGYEWGDSSIRWGWVPVADINYETKSRADEIRLVETISQYSEVKSLSVEI